MEISAIKQRLSISMVLQHYGLKPDKNTKMCCPFHEDKTPSMQIYYKTQTAYFILSKYGTCLDPHGISRLINEGKERKDKIQPLKIRQSVIANLLKSGNDLRVVQVYIGHRRSSSTEEYRQTELEALQNAVNQFHPRK